MPSLGSPLRTWAGWRAGERRHRGRRCWRFHRSRTIRQRFVASRTKASPPPPGFPYAPHPEAPAPSPLLLPDGGRKKNRRCGEEKEGGLLVVKFLCDPLLLLPTSSYSWELLCGREQKLPPTSGSFCPSPRCCWRSTGKSFSQQHGTNHRANFLWPVLQASSVTSLKLPFLSASPIQSSSVRHTQIPYHRRPSQINKTYGRGKATWRLAGFYEDIGDCFIVPLPQLVWKSRANFLTG